MSEQMFALYFWLIAISASYAVVAALSFHERDPATAAVIHEEQ